METQIGIELENSILASKWCVNCYPKKEYAFFINEGDSLCEECFKILKSEVIDEVYEFALNERDKADKEFRKKLDDDYLQGYYIAMNTVAKFIEKKL